MRIEKIKVSTPGSVRPGDYLVLDKPGSTVSGTVRTVKMKDFILEGSICVRMDAWPDITVTREVHVAEAGDVGYATVRGVHNIKVMKTDTFRDPYGNPWEWVSEPFQTQHSMTQYTMHPNQDVTNFRPADDHKCTPLPSDAPTIQGKDLKAWYKTAQGAIGEARRWMGKFHEANNAEEEVANLKSEVAMLERLKDAVNAQSKAASEAAARHKAEVQRLRGKLTEPEYGFDVQIKQEYGKADHVTVKKDGTTITEGYIHNPLTEPRKLRVEPEVAVGNLTRAAIQREMESSGLGYAAAKRATTALLDLMTGKTQ